MTYLDMMNIFMPTSCQIDYAKVQDGNEISRLLTTYSQVKTLAGVCKRLIEDIKG
jgi:hypothetical protein